MSEPVCYDSIQDPLDDEDREIVDLDTWDWANPVNVFVHPNLGFIFPIRFTGDEAGRLRRLAHAEGMATHDLIKHAALAGLPQAVSM